MAGGEWEHERAGHNDRRESSRYDQTDVVGPRLPGSIRLNNHHPDSSVFIVEFIAKVPKLDAGR